MRSREDKLRFYHLMSAWAKARLGDEAAADDHVKQALEGVPDNNLPLLSEIQYYAGRVALAQKRRKEARQAFEKALAYIPDGLYRPRIEVELERLA